MAEYIIKQKVTDRMGCCLANAKAEYKSAKDEFTKARFGDYISSIQAMIDVVECSETADVQPVIHAEWILFDKDCCGRAFYCSNCRKVTTTDDFENTPLEREEYFCPRCGADMRGDENG